MVQLLPEYHLFTKSLIELPNAELATAGRKSVVNDKRYLGDLRSIVTCGEPQELNSHVFPFPTSPP